jgi:hypothetical protein
VLRILHRGFLFDRRASRQNLPRRVVEVSLTAPSLGDLPGDCRWPALLTAASLFGWVSQALALEDAATSRHFRGSDREAGSDVRVQPEETRCRLEMEEERHPQEPARQLAPCAVARR